MSIETYQTTAAADVLAKTGMPTWKNGMMQFRLLVSDREFCVERSRPKHLSVHAAADYMALCLLRDHLRQWLAKKLICLSTKYGGWNTMEYGFWDDTPGWKWFDDEDEALLASVREVLGTEAE